MSVIKILPEDLVNKIAAGEVVERPASVVKELLDNAIDAKANQITIDIKNGGKTSILIIDNGSGMNKEDLEMAFRPHATSKISTMDDLLNIKSYGFRGEALSSIASVSKVKVKSRKGNADTGYELVMEGGNVISLSEVGAPVGTSIEITDLFYNVPARKEFLRIDQVEYKSILQIVNGLVLANANIGFNLINNGNSVYVLQKEQQLEHRISDVLGEDNYQAMTAIFFEHPHIEIYGYVGKPEIASENPKNQFIFVNKRKINDKSIAFAIKDAFSSLIPKNYYPQYVIFIDVPSNIVDVNVHPRKEEVKFSEPNLIFSSVKASIQKALDRANLTPGSVPVPAPSDVADKSPLGQFPAMPRPSGLTGSVKDNPFGPGTFPPSPLGPKTAKPDPFSPFPGMPARKPSPFDPFGAKDPNNKNPFAFPPTGNNPFAFNDDFDEEPKDTETKSKSKFGDMLYIKNLYIAKESHDGMIIYDQHAVHERVIYENLIKSHEQKAENSDSQKLLTPLVLNLSVEEALVVSENHDKIQASGIFLEEFGPNTYKVTEVPAILADLDLKTVIREVIEDLEKDNSIKETNNQTDRILTYLACRSAYKAGDKIPDVEVEAMIEQLEKTDIKYTCPHGRPVKIEISMAEFAKMFLRTQ